jgi:hypothetical protein
MTFEQAWHSVQDVRGTFSDELKYGDAGRCPLTVKGQMPGSPYFHALRTAHGVCLLLCPVIPYFVKACVGLWPGRIGNHAMPASPYVAVAYYSFVGSHVLAISAGFVVVESKSSSGTIIQERESPDSHKEQIGRSAFPASTAIQKRCLPRIGNLNRDNSARASSRPGKES